MSMEDESLKKLLREQDELEQKRLDIKKKIDELKKKQDDLEKQREKEIEEEEIIFDIRNRDIFHLITKTLSLIDKRTIAYSKRVAYIYYKILQYTGEYDKKTLAKYAIIGLFHDLGEFKVEHEEKYREKDRNNAWAHSIYSYLYLKNFSPLGDMCNVVLYHHLSEKKFGLIQTEYKFEAAALMIAVRLEHYLDDYESEELNLKKMFADLNEPGVSKIVKKAGLIAIYAVKQYNLSSKLINESFMEEIEELSADMIIAEEEKWKYLELLMYAFDFQTDEAFLDTLRTMRISHEIGEVMLVSEMEKKALAYGTLLYDIGKFAIPIEILRKPGKLTSAEMYIVRSHTAYTEYLLQDIVDEEVLNIAVRHHERMDGSGYPNGLQGSELSLGERILAVADVVSALSADRSYRRALNKQEILEVLKNEVGNKKLCPFVVDALFKKYDVIMTSANVSIQKATQEFVRGTHVAYKQLYAKLKDF